LPVAYRRSTKARALALSTPDEAERLLEGGPLPRLEARLAYLADNLRYEEAARLLDESAKSGIQEQHPVPATPREDFDADSILGDVLKIDGAIGAALVQATTGAILGQLAVGRGLDMTRAAKIAQDLVQAALRLRDGIEDIMITVDNQYHVIRVLGAGEDMFVHLVLDRERASLGLARHQLAKLARNSGH